MRLACITFVTCLMCIALVAVFGLGCTREAPTTVRADPSGDASRPVDQDSPRIEDAAPETVETVIAPLAPLPVTGCAVDADCAVTSLDVGGPTTCCFRCCSITAGTKAAVTAFEAACAKLKPACAPVACACPMPPYKPKCDGGKCVAVY